MSARTVGLSLALLLCAGCQVELENAPCETDANCPEGQFCNAEAKKCAVECVSDPLCSQATAGGSVCAVPPAGGAATGACVAITEGCLRIQNVTPCANSAEVCVSGACVCPTVSAVATEGAGCDPNQATTACGQNKAFTCKPSGGCHTWEADDCGAKQLTCTIAGGNGAHCECSPHGADTTYYADPVNGTPSTSPLRASGIANPPQCRFATLTEALTRATGNNGTVVASGWPYPAWKAATAYRVNALVRPSTPNGHHYRATISTGSSGASEPIWPVNPGGDVTDGNINWREEPGEAVVFGDARFPLQVPDGVTLTTIDCLSGGTGCEPSRYVFGFSPGISTGTPNEVNRLGAGSTNSGFSVVNAEGNMTAAAIDCTGTATVEGVRLVGQLSRQATPLAVGVRSSGACNLNVKGGVVVGGFSTAGLLLSAGTVNLQGTTFGVSDSSAYMNVGAGVVVNGGTLIAKDVQVTNAFDAGVVVTGTGTVHLDGGAVFGNGAFTGSPGVDVRGGTVTLEGVALSDNTDGLLVSAGTVTATKMTASNNRGSGVLVQTDAGVPVQLDGVQLLNNAQTGLTVGYGSAVLRGGSAVSGNGKDGGAGAGIWVRNTGALTVDGGPGKLVQVSDSGDAGVFIEGGAEIGGLTAQVNGAEGVVINSTSPTITLQGGTIQQNKSDGVTVRLASGGTGVTLRNLLIDANQGNGVWISGANGKVTAAVNACTIQGNTKSGLVMQRGSSTITAGTITGNDIAFNKQSGVTFKESSLVAFTSNALHSNVGPQILIQEAQYLGAPWLLTSTCTGPGAAPNRVYCYSGTVGIETIAGSTEADGLWWSHSPPAPPTDYKISGGSLTQTTDCGVEPTTCP